MSRFSRVEFVTLGVTALTVASLGLALRLLAPRVGRGGRRRDGVPRAAIRLERLVLKEEGR